MIGEQCESCITLTCALVMSLLDHIVIHGYELSFQHWTLSTYYVIPWLVVIYCHKLRITDFISMCIFLKQSAAFGQVSEPSCFHCLEAFKLAFLKSNVTLDDKILCGWRCSLMLNVLSSLTRTILFLLTYLKNHSTNWNLLWKCEVRWKSWGEGI